MKLTTLQDLCGILPRAEAALRELARSKPLGKREGTAHKAGKTLQNYAEALRAFCKWTVGRGYLSEDPLAGLAPFDTTPEATRRAMTVDEVARLLDACPVKRRLSYEVALVSGLRRGELRELRVKHLDAKRAGLCLEAAWTKNRKAGFQPLPATLAARLAEAVAGQDGEAALLAGLPRDAAGAFDRDLKAAGISKWGPGGKRDFHALRVAYVSFVVEAGASAKEAQALARHSTAALTLNTYAKARDERLAEVAEAVGLAILPQAGEARALRTGTDGREVTVAGGIRRAENTTATQPEHNRPMPETQALALQAVVREGSGVRIPHAP